MTNRLQRCLPVLIMAAAHVRVCAQCIDSERRVSTLAVLGYVLENAFRHDTSRRAKGRYTNAVRDSQRPLACYKPSPSIAQ
jgi:hypothetical protein